VTSSPRPGLLVLVIDDHADGRVVLSELLGLHGYRSVAAATGEAGLLAFAAEAPDAVILDLGLPDVSGALVAARLRQRSDVPIIAYTGFVDPWRHARARTAGCDAVLVKPTEIAAVVRVLEQVLAARSRPRAPRRR
jgi:two-component system, OmpR family, KDP operon response regulator KdpE